MKNKGTIITLIILLSIIVLALVIFLVSYLNGGLNFKNGVFRIGTKSSNVIFDKQFDLEEINNIEIKQDAGDVIFKESTNNYIQVILYGENENDVQVNTNEGILNIDYTHKNRFAFFNFGVKANDIIIYIPANYSNENRLNLFKKQKEKILIVILGM